MTYIENIFLCMVSPLLVAALCMGRRQLRFFLFCMAGMGVCLLSAYINTFLAAVCQADALAATAEIAPVVVIQNDIGNKHSPTVICAAITSKMNKAKLPTHVELNTRRQLGFVHL